MYTNNHTCQVESLQFQMLYLIWYLIILWKVLVTQSCLTLCDPLDCSLPGSFVHEILQARILEWVAIPFSRGSSQPKDWIEVSYIAGRFFTVWATREAQEYWSGPYFGTQEDTLQNSQKCYQVCSKTKQVLDWSPVQSSSYITIYPLVESKGDWEVKQHPDEFFLRILFWTQWWGSSFLGAQDSSTPRENVLYLTLLNALVKRRQWHPTPVLLPGKSHWRRSLVGCSPWGH